MTRRHAFVLLLLYAVFILAPGFFTFAPLDRDESRFAQASKQMLQSCTPGPCDFVEIRFQDTARNKKPVGIYWMQVASASLVGGAEAPIWAYRVPSAIGAVLAVLFTYLAGVALFGRTAAAAGAVVFALSFLLVAEAHVGKTDAMMCAAITAMMAGLARAFMRDRELKTLPPRWSDVLLVWGGLGMSALLKGPVGLMVGGTAVLALWLMGHRPGWLRLTRPAIGIAIALVIVLPWAVAITLQTGWSFWYDAIFGDMLSKAVSGQEQHGGFPGLYFLLVAATFFPGSILLLPAAWRTVQMRAEPWAVFLIAWAVPTWLIFEILPTKLPHYVLPIYPALALAVGGYFAARLKGEDDGTPRWTRLFAVGVWALIAAGMAAVFIAAPLYLSSDGVGFIDIVLALAVAGMAALVASLVLRARWRYVLTSCCVLMAIIVAGLGYRAEPAAERIHVSTRLAEAVRERTGWTPGKPIAATGYHEPSLVFLTATDIDLVDDGAAAARFLVDHADGLVLVEGRQMGAFTRTLAEAGLPYETIGLPLRGLNYSRGQEVEISIIRRRNGQ